MEAIIGYRMEIHNADVLSGQDPFGGNGMFLPSDGTGTAEEIIEAVNAAFGGIPAVAWPGVGAWISLEGMSLDSSAAARRWGQTWTSALSEC